MKVILFLLCLLPYSCWAKEIYLYGTFVNLSKQEFVDLFTQECGFEFGKKLTSRIINYNRGEGAPGGEINYKQYEIYFQIQAQKKARKIDFLLPKSCPPYDIILKKNDPINVIHSKEYGGRNYSHIKCNWKMNLKYYTLWSL